MRFEKRVLFRRFQVSRHMCIKEQEEERSIYLSAYRMWALRLFRCDCVNWHMVGSKYHTIRIRLGAHRRDIDHIAFEITEKNLSSIKRRSVTKLLQTHIKAYLGASKNLCAYNNFPMRCDRRDDVCAQLRWSFLQSLFERWKCFNTCLFVISQCM